MHYNAAVGIFVASVSCGAYCASLVTGVLSRSRIGYRQAIVMLCAYFFLGNTLGVTFFSRTSQLIYGRVVAGIAIGGFSGTVSEVGRLYTEVR